MTRCVWDAIAAPILWLPESRRRRILILGLGGGSIARIARALAPKAEIVGVELDRDVVRLARNGTSNSMRWVVHVEITDALGWLAGSRLVGASDSLRRDSRRRVHGLGG